MMFEINSIKRVYKSVINETLIDLRKVFEGDEGRQL